MLQFGEDLLDGIEVRAVGQQEQQVCFRIADRLADSLFFVASQVVHDDDITGLKRGYQ